MNRNDFEPKEGFYFLKTKAEKPVLVHGYFCTDLKGKFVFGFNTHDGGNLVTLDDLREESEIIPAVIYEFKDKDKPKKFELKTEREITGEDVFTILELLLAESENMNPKKNETIADFSKRKDEIRELISAFSEGSTHMIETQLYFKVKVKG